MERIAEQHLEQASKKSELESKLHQEYELARKKHQQKHFFQDNESTIAALALITVMFFVIIFTNFNTMTGHIVFAEENEHLIRVNETFNTTKIIDIADYEKDPRTTWTARNRTQEKR